MFAQTISWGERNYFDSVSTSLSLLTFSRSIIIITYKKRTANRYVCAQF